MDLDGDGRTDILSGSWPGEIYFFRRQKDGKFAASVLLKGHNGKPVHVGSASAVFVAHWNNDTVLDLLVGTILGEVWLVPGSAKRGPLAYEKPVRLEANGKHIQVQGDAGPVVADWDGDQKPDLVVGDEKGKVVWYRNVGKSGKPRLEAARTLVDNSPVGWGGDDKRNEGEWGLRVKPCVFDWNDDGYSDLLLGDMCGGFQAKPNQTEQQKQEERRANDRLPELRKKWVTAFQRYRQAKGEQREEMREVVQRLRDEIAAVQEIQAHYKPGNQSHGFVWLFLRTPSPQAKELP